MVVTICSILIFCEISEKITNIFMEIYFEMEQIKWYLFTIKKRRIYMAIISFSQKPIILDGFGSIQGSRVAFKNVNPFICIQLNP